MPQNSPVLIKNLANYEQLRDRVKETFLSGRQKIEEAKIETYLKTGQLIDAHISEKGSRKELYGNEVIERLVKDLEVSSSVLWRCLQFARSFKKILARGRESFPKRLVWSHYRKLITIPDEISRRSFMQRAEKGGWSAAELGGKIQLEMGGRSVEKVNKSGQLSKKQAKPYPKLIPKKGTLYTYRIIAPDSLNEDKDRLWMDLGFQAHRKVPRGIKGIKEGGIVESFVSNEDQYSVASSRRTEGDLFTYKGFVERVVDGDTLLVKIDLGFETRIRQYLRFRGINAPELSTEAGRKVKAFVERELSKVSHVILTSSRSDKYDRYLADVFYEKEPGKELYLNQVLLEEGLVERM